MQTADKLDALAAAIQAADAIVVGAGSGLSTSAGLVFTGERFREHFADFIALADAMVISGLERMHKPNRDIYDLLRARIGLPAAELVFVDDVEENCAGARAAGWHAIRFRTNAQVEADFAAAGY